MNCKNCKHFIRTELWSPAITNSEYLDCLRDGTPLRATEGCFRKLESTSNDGSCAKMVVGYKTPTDGVAYQWIDGTQAPRVGEDFGCIHFDEKLESVE